VDGVQTEEQQRPDYLAQIWSLCTTLSSEALDAAETKTKANQFNVDRGDVSFTEVAINLASAREVLKDAIEQQKLIQLPITVQKELFSNLQVISKALQGIMNNSDEIINLGNAVEVLNTSIWKYGLHNLSDQVLGYQEKLNQLKQQDVRVKQLVATLEKGRLASDNLTQLAEQAQKNIEQIEKSQLLMQQEVATATASRQQIQDEMTKATSAATTAQQAEAQVGQSSATVKAAVAEITPLETSIKGFFAEIDTYRKQIATSTDEASKFVTDSTASETARIKNATLAADAQLAKDQGESSAFFSEADAKLAELELNQKARSEETIEKNHQEVQSLLQELALMKESVKEQIAQATGLGQFGAFQSRQNKISEGKYYWVGAIGILVFIVICLTYYIALHAGQGDLHSAAFWIKLSMNVPLGFLISFCTIQYSRERRLEEEYAFKASISVSLNPYREMIFSILEKDGAVADGTYTSFVVDSVRNVFTSPTEKIFDSPKRFEGVSEKSLKATAELIGTAVKAAK
jgi:hypothetical protein